MSLEYDEPGKGWNVSQFGWLNLSFGANAQGQRLSLRLKIEKTPKELASARTCRIVREGRDRYFAVFTFKGQKKARQRGTRVVYIDPNLKNFGYALDTEGRAFELSNLEKLKACKSRSSKSKQAYASLMATSLQIWTRGHQPERAVTRAFAAGTPAGALNSHWRPLSGLPSIRRAIGAWYNPRRLSTRR